MRYCTHPSHTLDGSLPWILDGEPDHVHEKPRLRYVEGEWIDVALREGLREALKDDAT
jgi:hypothetical protein